MGSIPCQNRATNYNAHLGLLDKGPTINMLVVCNSWYLEPLDLLNGQALGCSQLSPLGMIETLIGS